MTVICGYKNTKETPLLAQRAPIMKPLLEPWIQLNPGDDSAIKQTFKSITATIQKSDEKWSAVLTTNIGTIVFSIGDIFDNQEDAKNWCNANVTIAYDIKDPVVVDKAFAEFQLAMVKYNIDLEEFNKNIKIYSEKMGIWIKQNSEWMSSKYRTPSRPGPQPNQPSKPAVDPGPMPIQPSPPIRPIDPRDMSPVRPPISPLPPRAR